jgi:hypothetical protein
MVIHFHRCFGVIYFHGLFLSLRFFLDGAQF